MVAGAEVAAVSASSLPHAAVVRARASTAATGRCVASREVLSRGMV